MKVAFLGTSSFACPALEAVASRHDVSLVVTQPDRPAGRRGVLSAPPVKEAALRLGLAVDQPAKINTSDAVRRLSAAEPEAIVVAAYGQILRPDIFTIPPLGTINIHASLLPAYRGAAPVRWAIVRGETTTGITTFLIDKGMDTGDLLLRRSLDIEPDETAGVLEDRLATLGAETILETLDGLLSGTIQPEPQPVDGVSYAPMLARDDGRIDWAVSALDVHNKIRGMSPWPGAWTTLDGVRIKVLKSVRTDISVGEIEPGAVALAETGRLLVGSHDELIEILAIQREGRPRTDGRAFVNGLRGGVRFD